MSKQCCSVIKTPLVVARNVIASPYNKQKFDVNQRLAVDSVNFHLKIRCAQSIPQIERLVLDLIHDGACIKVPEMTLNLRSLVY
jgi:hypothetical protein